MMAGSTAVVAQYCRVHGLDGLPLLQRAQADLAMDPENADALAFLATAERALATAAPASTREPPTSPLSPDQPSSFADGRYQVQRFLGERGKKKVYLA